MTELDLSSELVVISGAAGGLEPLATKGPHDQTPGGVSPCATANVRMAMAGYWDLFRLSGDWGRAGSVPCEHERSPRKRRGPTSPG